MLRNDFGSINVNKEDFIVSKLYILHKSFCGIVICFFNYYFLLPINRESIAFESNFEVEILVDLHVLGSPVFENHIFSVVFACVCLLST